MGVCSDRSSDDESTAVGHGGELLIGALRRIAAGRGCTVFTRRDFATAFPGDADEVFATLRAFLQSLAHGGRRKLRVGLPGSCRMTPDETAIIALIAAAQVDDAARLDAHLCWLVRGDARLLIAMMTRALATALAVHGQWLQLPPCPCPSPSRCAGPSLSPLAGEGLGEGQPPSSRFPQSAPHLTPTPTLPR
jgi:hypothetical protein